MQADVYPSRLLVGAIFEPARMYDHPTPRCRLVVERSISFAQPAGLDLKVDVWRPDDKKTRPGVLLIVGGSWRNAVRSDFNSLAVILAGWGYVVANMEYRTSPDHVWPAQLQDVKTCARWLRANAETFGVDPARIGSMGGSAGGHLSAMLALTASHEPFEGQGNNDQSSDVRAAVCLCAPTDIRVLAKYMANKDTPRFLLGGTPEELPDVCADASPANWLSAEAAPTLFIHGDKDPIVPIEPTRETSEQLNQLGAESHFLTLPEIDHGVAVAMVRRPDPVPMQLTRDFLKKHLQPPAM